MMNWGAQRKPSSSSSGPFSWLSKFKQMRNNSDPNHGKMKQKPKNIIDDAKKHGKTQQGSALKLREKDGYNGGVTVGDESDDRKVDGYDHREKEYENIRRRFEKKAQQVLEQQLLKLEREAREKVEEEEEEEDNLLPFESSSPKTICTPRTHYFATSSELKNSSSLRNIIQDRVSQKKMSSQMAQNLKESEELNLKVKTEKQKPPKALQRRKAKIRIYSPRMVSKVEVCRIKALEDMRKAGKLKNNNMKKLEREEIFVEETRPGSLDSFAVIKCSLDPRKDFRDSMIEMIMEKQISQAEEMEELLACYLTLNADEYHDLIIKVFRQIWFDLSQHGLDIKSCYE